MTRRTRTPITVAALFLGLVGLGVLPASGQQDGGAPLHVEGAFLGGPKFVYRGAEPQPALNTMGTRLSPELEALMGQHPDALATAQSARTWAIVGLVGVTGLAVVSAIDLIDTLRDADKINEGNLDINGGGAGVLDYVITGGVAATGLLMANSRFKKGIRMFNEAEGYREGGASFASAAPALYVSLPTVRRTAEGTAWGFGASIRH